MAGPPPRGTAPSQAGDYNAYQGHLSRVEERLFADAADAAWDNHSLLAAALVASGVDQEDRLVYYQLVVGQWVDELRRSRRMTGAPARQAQELLEFMHRRILRGGYALDCTDLTSALDHGRFNCVSASVLFHCLAEQFGLRVCGLETPGHAMARVLLPDGNLDVETTCPEWFRVAGDPKKRAESAAPALAAPCSAVRADSTFRQVTDVQLVAMIYYNRGVDLLGQKRFAEALAANAKALRLDPSSTTARGNLLATLNNWAISLSGEGSFVRAVELLREGIAVDSGYAPFQTNYLRVHRQWVEQLCKRQCYREALDVLGEAARVRPEEPYFAHARQEVQRRRTETLGPVSRPTAAGTPAQGE